MELGLVNVPALKKNPLPFYFTNAGPVLLNAVTEASTMPVGYAGTVRARAVIGTAELRKNNTGSWANNIILSNGDLLNVRMTSSASYNTTLNSTIRIGTYTTVWSVTTLTNPSLSFTNITNALRNTVYSQQATNNSNMVQTVSVTDGELSLNGSTGWASSIEVPANTSFWVRQTSSASRGTVTTAVIEIESLSLTYNWTVTTGVVTPGSTSLTANGSFVVPAYDTLVVTVWGGGGQGGGMYGEHGGVPWNGANGTSSIFLTLNAGGGIGGEGGRFIGEGGPGGTPSGGDINTEGTRGRDYYEGWTSPWTYAPNAGANTVGAGSAGWYYYNSDPPTQWTLAAGGSGAYVRKTYYDGGPLAEGTSVVVTIGKGGAMSMLMGPSPAKDGRVDITWS